MTKADIARIVYERHGGISNREAARLVEIIFDSIKNRLGGGEKVQITGFGTFVIRQKRERRGRNPHGHAARVHESPGGNACAECIVRPHRLAGRG